MAVRSLRQFAKVADSDVPSLVDHKTEPNAGLGKAISYRCRKWLSVTLF